MVHLLLAVIYLAFVSLGLPDSLLGAAWPSMYVEFGVPLSYEGILSMVIAAGTIVSSLQSDRLTRLLGAGKITALSVAMTAVALLGFSFTRSFWVLCLWGIPYGLGAGSVDAALNNYVALHYSSRHMSWLHCMWGLGATIGPYIMGMALTRGDGWGGGYRTLSFLQIGLTAILLFSLPLWKNRKTQEAEEGKPAGKALTLRQIAGIPGAKEVMVCFFCYCAVEQTTILWGSSYLMLHKGFSAEGSQLCQHLLFGHYLGTGRLRVCNYEAQRHPDDPFGAGACSCGDPVYAGAGAGVLGLGWPGFGGAGVRAGVSLYHPLHPCPFWRPALPGYHWGANGQRLCGHLPDAPLVWPDSQPHHRGPAACLFAGAFRAYGGHS